MIQVMARAAFRRRPDGLVEIPRARRARWVLPAVGGILVILPLALSLVVLLPPVVLAIPPMTLGLGLWILMRSLDSPEPRSSAPAGGSCRVVPLRAARPRAWLHRSPPGRA
jgi:hypothetical protein